jgi:aminoglycoside 3-N-acetyltransferase
MIEELVRRVMRALPPRISRRLKAMVGPAVKRQLSKRSEARQKETQPHFHREQLIDDLKACGFADGQIVFVHSSLRSLGYIDGGASTVVEALRTALVERHDGTLAMPLFSLDASMYSTLQSGDVFDVRSSPSRMGAITEAFRRCPGVQRSLHPTHSVGALGSRAAWLVDAHHTCGSNFGDGSPLGRLLSAGGLIMGLGTDLGPVTFYHVLEDRHGHFPRRVYTADSPLGATCIDRDGATHELAIMCHDPEQSKTRIDRAEGLWIRRYITEYLERHGGLRWHTIGAGTAWVIDSRDMYRCLQDLLSAGITIYTTEAEFAALAAGGGSR